MVLSHGNDLSSWNLEGENRMTTVRGVRSLRVGGELAPLFSFFFSADSADTTVYSRQGTSVHLPFKIRPVFPSSLFSCPRLQAWR